MPPWFYPLMHPEASLFQAEQQQLIVGLAATFRNSPAKGGGLPCQSVPTFDRLLAQVSLSHAEKGEGTGSQPGS